MDNPTLANEAIIAGERKIGDLTVYPISMGRYALLELIESPFITKDKEFTVYNLVPTFYVMCSEKSQLKGYTRKNIDDLIEKSLAWSDDINTDLVPKMIDKIAEELGLMKKISPQAAEDSNSSKKETAQTAG